MKQNEIKKYREFGLFVGFFFPFLIGWIIPTLFAHSFRDWTLFIGIPLILLGIFRPRMLKFPYLFWIKIGNILGFINSKLILGGIFFLILFPISCLMKLTGYDPLKKKTNTLKSYREIRENDKIDLNKIFKICTHL